MRCKTVPLPLLAHFSRGNGWSFVLTKALLASATQYLLYVYRQKSKTIVKKSLGELYGLFRIPGTWMGLFSVQTHRSVVVPWIEVCSVQWPGLISCLPQPSHVHSSRGSKNTAPLCCVGLACTDLSHRAEGKRHFSATRGHFGFIGGDYAGPCELGHCQSPTYKNRKHVETQIYHVLAASKLKLT